MGEGVAPKEESKKMFRRKEGISAENCVAIWSTLLHGIIVFYRCRYEKSKSDLSS